MVLTELFDFVTAAPAVKTGEVFSGLSNINISMISNILNISILYLMQT